MIIACPACATRYAVPDSAIGLEGRTVRCAKCKHSWFQDGPELARPVAADQAGEGVQSRAEAARPAAAPQTSPPPPRQPAARPEPATDPVEAVEAPTAPMVAAAAPSWEEAQEPSRAQVQAEPAPSPTAPPFEDLPPAQPWTEEPEADPVHGSAEEEVSHFDHGPPFRRRRNWLRWGTWAAGGFAALALAAMAAMSSFGVPSWMPVEQPLFGADPGLKVDFPPSEQERRTLPNGAEFFGARVVVKNEARETKTVPPLLIVLRDSRERVVYSWELLPPQRTLAPGEAMTINEAMTDVPKSAVYADIGWAPR